MNAEQEPKYGIDNGRLVSRHSGKPVPEDEPLFVLQGGDKHATATLRYYRSLLTGTESHATAVEKRIKQFETFAKEHPDRMKEPHTPAPPKVEAEPQDAQAEESK